MIKVGINGFGRIGRLVLRAALAQKDMEVKAINNRSDAENMAYLFKYDSVQGRYPGAVGNLEDSLLIDGREIRVWQADDPATIPWGKLDVDLVIECTGAFLTRESVAGHLAGGASKVVISAPAKGSPDIPTVVMGVNDHILKPEHSIVSNASCTTNCLAPMVKVLHEAFGIENGLMTTIHSYTRDQSLVDRSHKDPRRGRAAGVSLVPTSTGAASAIGQVIPQLKGKLDGMAVRVPTADGSFTDLVATIQQSATPESINEVFRQAAAGPMQGILEYNEDPLVSADIVGNPHSCVFDPASTLVTGERLVKICAWYDNEWGYANRCVDLVHRLAQPSDKSQSNDPYTAEMDIVPLTLNKAAVLLNRL